MVDAMGIDDNGDYGANERIPQPEDAYLSCEYAAPPDRGRNGGKNARLI
jgi:hypothetical protein